MFEVFSGDFSIVRRFLDFTMWETGMDSVQWVQGVFGLSLPLGAESSRDFR